MNHDDYPRGSCGGWRSPTAPTGYGGNGTAEIRERLRALEVQSDNDRTNATERLGAQAQRLSGIDHRLSGLDHRTNGHTARITTLEATTARHSETLGQEPLLMARIAALEAVAMTRRNAVYYAASLVVAVLVISGKMTLCQALGFARLFVPGLPEAECSAN